MRHLRADYDAIQPWPVKRPHIIRDYDVVGGHPKGVIVNATSWPEDAVGEALATTAEPIIPNDEPVFLLRAIDPVAAGVVRSWARAALDAGSDPALCRRVMEWADEMDEYRERQDRVKLYPDTPEGMLR